MLIFYWTLVSTFFLGILTRLSYDKRFRMLGIFWVILIAAILSLVSGLRLRGAGGAGVPERL